MAEPANVHQISYSRTRLTPDLHVRIIIGPACRAPDCIATEAAGEFVLKALDPVVLHIRVRCPCGKRFALEARLSRSVPSLELGKILTNALADTLQLGFSDSESLDCADDEFPSDIEEVN